MLQGDVLVCPDLGIGVIGEPCELKHSFEGNQSSVIGLFILLALANVFIDVDSFTIVVCIFCHISQVVKHFICFVLSVQFLQD